MKALLNLKHYDNINTHFFRLLDNGFEGTRYFKQKLVMKVYAFYRKIKANVSLKEIWADVKLYMWFEEHPTQGCMQNIIGDRSGD